MCGIFALLNNKNSFDKELINSSFKKGVKRGPEGSFLLDTPNLLTLGFHRLAINGLNPKSDQPIIIDGITLISPSSFLIIFFNKLMVKKGLTAS